MTAKRPTSTERIRTALADEIVRGLLGPGAVLDEVTLAERFAVSRTPVREAIRQLEAIGFVEARPHRGAVVPNFTPEKLTEMFAVMADLEGLCARYAAQAGDPAARARLVAALEECRTVAAVGDVAAYRTANVGFHEALYAAAGNSYLAEVTRGVRIRLQPFRQVQFDAAGRPEQSAAEHAGIVAAVLAGDAAEAERLARAHLRAVRVSVGQVAPKLRS